VDIGAQDAPKTISQGDLFDGWHGLNPLRNQRLGDFDRNGPGIEVIEAAR
jgi:hypothetical protein